MKNSTIRRGCLAIAASTALLTGVVITAGPAGADHSWIEDSYTKSAGYTQDNAYAKCTGEGSGGMWAHRWKRFECVTHYKTPGFPPKNWDYTQLVVTA